jgi:hypothetical protein
MATETPISVATAWGRLAQLVRAPALHAGCRRFESVTAYHFPPIAGSVGPRFDEACPVIPSSARSLPANTQPPGSWPRSIFRRFPKDRYQTEVESWRNLQSANIEFTMKRLRDPIKADPEP